MTEKSLIFSAGCYIASMKTSLIILLMLLCTKLTFAQEHQLIVQVPLQSEASISKLHKQLNAVEGIHFSGYVKHASCLLIRYNSNLFCNAAAVTHVIKKANKKIKCKVIEGYTAYDVIDGKLKKPVLYASGK